MSFDPSILIVREAIASVSLSHADDCRCRVCRAADGDERAFAEIVIAVRADPPLREERTE